MECVTGAVAAMGACFFTNPLEVVKTRIQLQGELKAKGQHPVYYKNIFHAAYVIVKNDGLFALQKGLAPALVVQCSLNGMRLGIYQFAENRGFIRDSNGKTIFHRSALTAGIGGVLGHVPANPMFLVKTHLQAQAASSIAVGYQRQQTGMLKALKDIYKTDGMKGLYRGVSGTFPRAFIGGGSQLVTFEYAKDFLVQYSYLQDKKNLTAFLASMAGGVVVTLAMTPFDLILTRIYNQPTYPDGTGQFYKSYTDCILKIYRSEGVLAFYKGMGSVYLRIGPHTVICLVFWENLKVLQEKYL